MASFGIVGIAVLAAGISMTDLRNWLESDRALDGELLDAMQVAETDHPGLGRALVFPYIRDGKPYAAKFRTGDKRWSSSSGVSRGLYNEDDLGRLNDLPVVITEGEIDCLSVMQAGWERAVSLPDGWGETGKREALTTAVERLKQSPYVIAAGDNDKAGSSFPKTLANILAGHDVRYAEWPEGCKDANDVLVQLGPDRLRECLSEAKRIDPPGGVITGLLDMPPMPERRVLRMGMAPYNFGLAFEVGALSVGTGTPGSGKSTFTTFCAYHVAQHENIRVGFLSFETHPHRTRDHLALLHGGATWEGLTDRARADLHERFRIVHRTFDDGEHHLGWLQSMVYTLAVRDGCKLIVVDPWNELEHLPEPGESMTNYINFALQQMRQWAEQYETHICLVAHPRKMPTDGKPRAPSGYDIADSAAFANKPSLGFTVHQEAKEGEHWVRIVTWKVRDTHLYGFAKGSFRLTFDADRMSYRKYSSETHTKQSPDQRGRTWDQ